MIRLHNVWNFCCNYVSFWFAIVLNFSSHNNYVIYLLNVVTYILMMLELSYILARLNYVQKLRWNIVIFSLCSIATKKWLKISNYYIICLLGKYLSQNFCGKLCSMIIWFWYQIGSSFFCCYNFDVPMFSHIFHSFSENWIIH